MISRPVTAFCVLLVQLPERCGCYSAPPLATLASRAPPRRARFVRLGLEEEDITRALRQEAARRGSDVHLGKFDKLKKIGPHHTTSPRQVVEHVITELRNGDIQQAFTFTCAPPWKQGTHRSNTDWSQRMDWEKCQIINDSCSGGIATLPCFEQKLRTKYAALLDTQQYRFLGDDSAWQSKNGLEKFEAPKEYVVEIDSPAGRHLFRFRLVYDWLLYCHLVATVSSFAVDGERFFPGTSDASESDI